MPLDEQSRRLTQFVIGNQQYEFNRLFYGISIGPAAFSSFMSKFFRPLILKKNAIIYLDDVFMQSQTKEEMFKVLEHHHKILQNENLKAAPDKSHFFLTRVKFLGHNIERKTITSLKSRIDAIQKLQPPTNKKKVQEFLGMLNFLSKYVYKTQFYLRPFYNILRQQNNFEWNTEHQTRFEEIKKLLTEQISNTIQNQINHSMQCAMLQILHRRSIITITQWYKQNEPYISKFSIIHSSRAKTLNSNERMYSHTLYTYRI